MATKKSKSARKSSSKSSAANSRKRVVWEDNAKIKVVGEHSRREGSRYFGGFEAMKKANTVGAFRKARAKTGDAQELLRAALADGYVKVA